MSNSKNTDEVINKDDGTATKNNSRTSIMNQNLNQNLNQNCIDLFLNYRTIILCICILLSIFAININLFDNDLVVVTSISSQKELFKQGLDISSSALQRSYPTLEYINAVPVQNLSHAYELFSTQEMNTTNTVTINSQTYTYKLTQEEVLDFLGISIEKSYFSNIKLGTDLSGGSRIILQAVDNLTQEEFKELQYIVENRLNVFGASGAQVKIITDRFSSSQFLLIESPNSNKNSILELINRQGDFQAKLGNVTVFTGLDVRGVLDNAENSQIQCSSSSPYQCSISFAVQISSEAAENVLKEASKLESVGSYLTEELSFHLDGEVKESLRVSSTFKYQKVLNPQITLNGNSQESLELARKSAQHEKKIIETILLTKPLPSELEIIQSFSQSPQLSEKFLQNALVVAIFSMLVVSAIIALRYKKPIIFGLIAAVLTSEILLIFGASVLFKISLDLAAIGGLIAAIGTGVDDQIIITDEYFSKRKREDRENLSLRKIKHAMIIIIIAYVTTLAAIGPLFFAGLSLLQGFAFMILLGVSIGVFITRPVYATALRIVTTTRSQREEEAQIIREEEEEEKR